MAAAASGGSSLPAYGLCVSTSPTCGRVGDLLPAIAASVLQTRGSKQGYVFDLSEPAPAAVPLTNGTGWRSEQMGGAGVGLPHHKS